MKGEKKMPMKRDINIALSQARLRCENGLQFVRQYCWQAISLSLQANSPQHKHGIYMITENMKSEMKRHDM